MSAMSWAHDGERVEVKSKASSSPPSHRAVRFSGAQPFEMSISTTSVPDRQALALMPAGDPSPWTIIFIRLMVLALFLIRLWLRLMRHRLHPLIKCPRRDQLVCAAQALSAPGFGTEPGTTVE